MEYIPASLQAKTSETAMTDSPFFTSGTTDQQKYPGQGAQKTIIDGNINGFDILVRVQAPNVPVISKGCVTQHRVLHYCMPNFRRSVHRQGSARQGGRGKQRIDPLLACDDHEPDDIDDTSTERVCGFFFLSNLTAFHLL